MKVVLLSGIRRVIVTFRNLLMIAWLLPPAGFAVEIFGGFWGSRKSRVAAWMSVGCIATGFVCSFSALMIWGNSNNFWKVEHQSEHHAASYPTRAALADELKRLIEAKIPLEGAADHGVSEALYLHDPDFNGLELYWDKPESEWPRDAGGALRMVTDPLGLDDLLSELE